MLPFARRTPARCLAPVMVAAVLAAPSAALATPLEYLSVTDPLQSELRILEAYAPDAAGGRIGLPSPGTLPVRRRDLLREGVAAAAGRGPRRIALVRLERAFARDAEPGWGAAALPGSGSRLWQRVEPGGDRAEVSLGLEGAASAHSPLRDAAARWSDGSGAHARVALQVDRWLAYTHLWAGQLRGAERFTDALVAGTDVALQTEESYLAYDGGMRWGAMIGRNRWHWGPGEEGSLLISRSSAPMTGLMLHVRFPALGLDATALHTTLEAGGGEQLAAHRLEWRACESLRIGATETARYRSSGYQAVYLASVIPFSLAQRLLDQDAVVDTTGALRNNVMLGLDAAWRVADGTRLYGEVMIDDLHAKSAATPNKLGVQLGAEGVGDVHGARLSWGSEYTRLSRYVYTSFYGRSYFAQGQPVGFPTGPDSERLRVRMAWDPGPDWQCSLAAARTTRGEDAQAAYTPGAPVPDVWTFAGIAERSRSLEAAIRWWPATGVDLSMRTGRVWRENAAHVTGASDAAWEIAAAARLTR